MKKKIAVKKIATANPIQREPFATGEQYLFRLVTNFWVGRIVSVHDKEIVLENASWIADTGRFFDAMNVGIDKISSSEIEPVNRRVVIGRGAVVDAVEYPFELPKEQK